MRIDFTNVEDVESYQSVPTGTYLCKLRDLREGLSRGGDPRWSFRLEVHEGEYAGRTAAWDSLTFSERGMARAKGVLQRLGYAVEGVLDLDLKELDGQMARVQVVPERREDPFSGKVIDRMRVPYMGYEPLEAHEQTTFVGG